MKTLVHEASAELHDSDSIADERMKACRLSLLVALILAENKVFRRTYSLAADIVRIHLLPASRKRTAMENHHKAIFIGIAEDSLIMSHGLLLVTTEEIDLDSLYSEVTHPFHLLLAEDRIAHNIYRSLLDIVPPSA